MEYKDQVLTELLDEFETRFFNNVKDISKTEKYVKIFQMARNIKNEEENIYERKLDCRY